MYRLWSRSNDKLRQGFCRSKAQFEQLERRDLLALTVEIAVDAVSESPGGEMLEATISRDGDTTAPLEVMLQSSDSSLIWVPAKVTIPSGETRLNVGIESVNNPDDEQDETVLLSANAIGHASASDTIVVANDDTSDKKTIGGKLSGVLAPDDFLVESNITVSQDAFLTLEPGSKLRIGTRLQIDVDGTLIANGTNTDTITFTSVIDTPSEADSWNGIRVNNGQADLSHADLEYAAFGVLVTGNSSLTVSDSDVHDNFWGIGVQASPGVEIGADEIRITRTRFHENQTGIALSSRSAGCSNSTVLANVHDNEIFANDSGISLSARYSDGCVPKAVSIVGGEISRNHIHHNSVGLRAMTESFFGAKGTIFTTLANNLINNNENEGISVRGDRSSQPLRVVNNTIVANGGAGIQHADQSFAIRNNVIVGNQWGLRSLDDFHADENLVTNNLLFDNTQGMAEHYPAWLGSLTTKNRNGIPADIGMNIHVSPRFADTDTYHLIESSPAIDAGTDIDAPPEDIDGDERAASNQFQTVIAGIGYYPIDIGYDEVVPARRVELRGRGQIYRQDFDVALGSVAVGDTHLPDGWFLKQNETVTSIISEQFPTNTVELGTYNAGMHEQPDRTLALGNSNGGTTSSFSFEASIREQDVRAVRLQFDVEAWAADPITVSTPGEAAFEIAFNVQPDADSTITNLGIATTGPSLVPPEPIGVGPQAIFTRNHLQIDAPFDVVPADVDSDGVSDLIVSKTNGISVLLGIGDGTFGLPLNHELPGIACPRFNSLYCSPLVVADFNKDKNLDVAVAILSSNEIMILNGNGDGTFAPSSPFAADGGPQAITAADFNGDGNHDLSVASSETGDISILIGDGQGGFAAETKYAAGVSRNYVVADVDADGHLDMLVGTKGLFLSLFFGEASGQFGEPLHLNTGQDTSHTVDVGDFDGNGTIDIVFTSSNVVSVMLNDGDRTFSPPIVNPTDDNPTSIDVRDFNADGRIDVAVADSRNGTISILLGKGDGTLQERQQYFTRHGFPKILRSTDLDNDGDYDLVVADRLGVSLFKHVRVTVDGNSSVNRASFDSGVVDVFIPRNGSIRLSFDVPERLRSNGWIFGLDNVSLALVGAGDANGDGVFNSTDLVKVFQSGEYEDGVAGNSSFADGDWNGDGEFSTADLVFAFQAGTYLATAIAASDVAAVVDLLVTQDVEQKRSWIFAV